MDLTETMLDLVKQLKRQCDLNKEHITFLEKEVNDLKERLDKQVKK